jgi:hypothetical protein
MATLSGTMRIENDPYSGNGFYGKEKHDEGQVFCETDVRKVQGYQEKRENHDHLRKPEAQTEYRDDALK